MAFGLAAVSLSQDYRQIGFGRERERELEADLILADELRSVRAIFSLRTCDVSLRAIVSDSSGAAV